MEVIGKRGDRTYYIHTLEEQAADFLPFNNQEFVLLIGVEQSEFDQQRLENLGRYLLEANLRDVVCAGSASAETEQLLDRLIIRGDWDRRRGGVVPTINEPRIDEAVFQFIGMTFPPNSDPAFALMLFLNKDARTALYRATFHEQIDKI